MDVKRKVIIGIAIILLLLAMYLIISAGDKQTDSKVIPCCHSIKPESGTCTSYHAKRS